MKTLDCNFHDEGSSDHISWVSYCTAKHHAEYHAKDRETRNANTDDSNELELNTDYGFNFVDAILRAWKLLWTRGLDLFRAFFSTALKCRVEGDESPISPGPVFKVVAVGLLIHGLYVSYSYVLAYKSKYSSGYFSSKYHQQTGEKLWRENTNFINLIPFQLIYPVCIWFPRQGNGLGYVSDNRDSLPTLSPSCNYSGTFVWLVCHFTEQLFIEHVFCARLCPLCWLYNGRQDPSLSIIIKLVLGKKIQ